ncbi:4-hydroxyphenylpyruvate dioxygenase [Thioalkalivibrio sp. XN8]|uniref:4-hydroxyphenylpyruvate dioxygenase n=1 Tax=Thioalkalivibrio sp. XN8 TaxID=2712863 RepID=UPI0013ECC45B|nr:4-hydroxyphenylpyruvate dioxygenase [Thioalkalivibrio sp. XN8]NGP53968.1 4-hydroxyphenylpyruvate dioxygenase [Thioalkalivibrio sp. XN8]
MTEVQDNPLGIDGFEFVEFAAPDAALLHSLFRHMGFTAIGRHRQRKVTLYRQGDVNFLVNEEPDSFAADFARAHGPSACGFAIRVADAAQARACAIDRGAAAITNKPGTLAVRAPVIEGIGGAALYLVDRYGDHGSSYDPDFEYFDGVDRHPAGFGLTFIDHLTHNVYQGNMDKWAGFYERIFNFREIRYFDIKGRQTGLVSRAMTAPDGMVRIPINEATDDKSQIAEYLEQYNGEGIQHIALFTDDIYGSVEALRGEGIEFLDVPDTYYEMVEGRVPEHGEDLERMCRNRILIDADRESGKRLLLQIFTQTNIGPIFFEIIQRKGNEGFGEGNFQALFESIERDQMRRGVI